FPPTGLEAVSCPNRWFLFEQNCYGFFETKLSWNDAETECTSFGNKAHLASILTKREMDTISSSLLTNYAESFRVWIGMYKIRGGKCLPKY
ncbi:regenerating islet-derived protein 4-like, partial [Pseudonaja textilis]|uniref:regenerating islet-derived protein 4-like n=1 Tax=Pseudonaja textilis TaxID=8673 RepID=UPI000EA8BC1C